MTGYKLTTSATTSTTTPTTTNAENKRQPPRHSNSFAKMAKTHGCFVIHNQTDPRQEFTIIPCTPGMQIWRVQLFMGQCTFAAATKASPGHFWVILAQTNTVTGYPAFEKFLFASKNTACTSSAVRELLKDGYTLTKREHVVHGMPCPPPLMCREIVGMPDGFADASHFCKPGRPGMLLLAARSTSIQAFREKKGIFEFVIASGADKCCLKITECPAKHAVVRDDGIVYVSVAVNGHRCVFVFFSRFEDYYYFAEIRKYLSDWSACFYRRPTGIVVDLWPVHPYGKLKKAVNFYLRCFNPAKRRLSRKEKTCKGKIRIF